MGMLGMTTCYGCKKLFVFNPDLVPIVNYEDGHAGPICKTCLEGSNEHLAELGLPQLYYLPGAYDPGE